LIIFIKIFYILGRQYPGQDLATLRSMTISNENEQVTSLRGGAADEAILSEKHKEKQFQNFYCGHMWFQVIRLPVERAAVQECRI